jgi:hypothetical protein
VAKDPEVKTSPTKAQAAESKPSWWQTAPGMLTAIAAIITATAGLIATLHQTGLLPSATNSSPPDVTETAAPSPSDSSTDSSAPSEQSSEQSSEQPGESSQSYNSLLTDGMEVSLPVGVGDTVDYKVLSARVEPMNAENLTLKLVIRCTSHYPYNINFWSNSFRLLVDGVPRSPINQLNELVEPESAVEGEVVFNFPVSTRAIILKIGDPGKETAQIPFDLP